MQIFNNINDVRFDFDRAHYFTRDDQREKSWADNYFLDVQMMLQPLNMESPNDSSFLQLRLIKRDDRRVKRMHVENSERNDLDRSESISRIPTSSLSRERAKFGRGCSRTRDSIPQGSCVGPHTFTRDRNFERRRDDATMRRPSSPRLQRVMLATSGRGW